MEGNFGFADTLLNTLMKYGNACPVMISSSTQATLEGRFANSEYGKSKRAGENLMFDYAKKTGARFPLSCTIMRYYQFLRRNFRSRMPGMWLEAAAET